MDNDSRESNPNDLFGDDVDIYSDEFWAPSFQAARAGMVDELHERLKKATQEIELINAEIEKLPLILDGNPHRIEVGRKLYWDFPTVPARTVMKVMGVKAKSAHEHAGPIYKHWDCWKCKSEVVSKEIKSRTELKEFEKSELEWLKVKRLSYYNAKKVSCPKCSALIQKEQDDENAKLRKQLEKEAAEKLAAENIEKAKREAVDRLRKMPYSEYLKTDHWQSLRTDALTAAGNACQVCNASRSKTLLDVHHRTYERRGSELLSDLTVLCRNCHERFHDRDESSIGDPHDHEQPTHDAHCLSYLPNPKPKKKNQ